VLKFTIFFTNFFRKNIANNVLYNYNNILYVAKINTNERWMADDVIHLFPSSLSIYLR